MKATAEVNVKNSLQEYCQKLSLPLPVYVTRQSDEKSFTSLVRLYREGQSLESEPLECASKGAFATKKAAEQDAAEGALRLIGKRK